MTAYVRLHIGASDVRAKHTTFVGGGMDLNMTEGVAGACMGVRPVDSGVGEHEARGNRETFGRQTHAAAERLARQIPALCDAGGALPTQVVLARALGVSHTLLREAISQLVARGVIDVRRRAGSRVLDERQWQIVDRHVVAWRLARATDPSFAMDLAQIRRVLEPLAAADVARQASPTQRARIVVACATRLAATSRAAYAAARRDLHVAIFAASPNQFLQQLTCLVPPVGEMLDQASDAPAIADGERHALVLLEAAIHDGNPVAAREGVERLNGWDLPRAGGHHIPGGGQ